MQARSWLGVLVVPYVPSPGHMDPSGVSTLVFLVRHAQHVKHSLLRSGEQVPWVPKPCAMLVGFAG